jgi:serine/threonine protein kinase
MATVASFHFTPPARFRLLRRLGEGGMGVVYEAFDNERNARVALKTLVAQTPEGLHRLKREFRALQDVHHPNLVSLGELISEGEQWFFTLELVDGVDFLRHVCPRDAVVEAGRSLFDARHTPTTQGGMAYDKTDPMDGSVVVASERASGVRAHAFDGARLRDGLAQLASGLAALHHAGKVHRDIKPSNVLVARDGRVVILDFGLVADAVRRNDASSVSQHLIGTPAYMAPEQAASLAVGPEADCYSVGVMLYEALTGRLPFSGTSLQLLMLKQGGEVVAPSAFVPDIAADLDDLCMRLMRHAPGERPTAREVHDFFRKSEGTTSLRTRSGLTTSPPFVGRARELEALHEAFRDTCDGKTVVLVIEGESGVGKTCLARTFAERAALERPDVVVLSGRCYEREAVPYKALDDVIEDLSRRLVRTPDLDLLELMPARIGALLRVFPAFRRVPAMSRKPTRSVAEVMSPRELRRRAFIALRELVNRIAMRNPLVVVIDDIQWGDADSLSALGELLHPPDSPPLLLVTTVRTSKESPADVVDPLHSLPADVRRIRVDPLSEEDARNLATDLLEASMPGHPTDVSAIVREAAGYPLFLDELVQHVAMQDSSGGELRLGDVLWSRIAHLDPAARALMELVAVAGTRFPQEAMIAALGRDVAEFDRIVSLLRVAHLVRTDVHGRGTIEPYHDRVRDAVLGHVDAATRAARHESLAIALNGLRSPDPEALATHWHGAGDSNRAAFQAARAAEDAANALAFDRAARWYERALEWSHPDEAKDVRALRLKLGEALANAGRGALAAAHFRAAAEGADEAESIDLRSRAASELLRGGHVADGIATLREVLASIGVAYPGSPVGALVRLLFLRLVLLLRGLRFTEREASQVAAGELTRIDTLYSVAMSLGPIDTIRGQMFQGYHVLRALRAGEPVRAARAISLESGFHAIAGHASWERAHRLAELATGLAERTKVPTAIGQAAFAHGGAAMLAGRFHESRERLLQAERIYREQCVGVWQEMAMARWFYVNTLFHTGALLELRERKAEYLRDAQERGDLYTAVNLRIGFMTFPALADDEPDRARSEIAAAMALWMKGAFHIEHHHEMMGHVFADLYEGRGSRALERVREARRALGRSLLLRIQLVRVESWYFRARASLAAILETGDRGVLPSVTRDARRIAREGAPWAAPMAMALFAAVSWQRGRDEGARAQLRDALLGFESSGMALYVAAARWTLGMLTSGPEAARDIETAETWMRSQSIRVPSRITRMLLPGFERRA